MNTIVVYTTPDNDVEVFGLFRDDKHADEWIMIKQEHGWKGHFLITELDQDGSLCESGLE
jgi:hypothetical protein